MNIFEVSRDKLWFNGFSLMLMFWHVLNIPKGAFSKKDENMENLIAISCEVDYEVYIPLLEKGMLNC